MPKRCLFFNSHFSILLLVCWSRTYLEKNVSLQLNKGRKVSGVLRGYDQFMNLVLGNALEETTGNQKNNIGTVVRSNISLFVLSFLIVGIFLLLGCAW